jgi:ABC-type lipoprotein release transport system permease subunit
MKIALRNLFSIPKKFIFMLLLQAVFVFLAFMIYGTINSLFYQSSLLPDAIEASEHQLVIQRLDEMPITQLEVEMFRNNSFVKEINDYETINSLFVSIGRTRIFSERLSVLKNNEILKGRFPESIDEIMISEDLMIYLDTDVDKNVTLRTANFEPYIFKIVGVSNKISKSVYFHDDFFINPDFIFKSVINKTTLGLVDDFGSSIRNNSYRTYIINDDFNQGEVFAYIGYEGSGVRDSSLKIETGYSFIKSIDVNATYQFSEALSTITISRTDYNTLLEEVMNLSNRYRIVLNVYDRYDGQRLLNQIDQSVYIVYYDALTQETDTSSFGYVLTVLAYLLIFVVGLLMLLLLRLIFKNMVQTRRKDFAIYRSIGASKKFLSRLIFFEQVLQIVIGTVLTGLLTLILVLSVLQIQNSLRYIEPFDIAIVFLVFSYMTLITPLKYNQMIYEVSVIETLSKVWEV